jgi:hypothetical protein
MATGDRSAAFGLTGIVGIIAILFGLRLTTAPAPSPQSQSPWMASGEGPAASRTAGGSAQPSKTRPPAYWNALDDARATYDTVGALVAIVPDPVESRGDWAFDSYVEGIRRAFERSGFLPDRFWLPWDRDRARGASATRSSLHDSVPGVLFFRGSGSSRHAWIIFLVGEVPTFGMHQAAFQRAVEGVDRISGAGSTLHIVGPSYSGTSRSLRDAINALPGRHLVGRGHLRQVEIVSGSATDVGNLALLDDPPHGLRFSATVHPDSLLSIIRDSVLGTARLGGRVAILVEGSTAYGQALQTGGLLRVPVPIGIGTLRSEVQSTGQGDAQAVPGQLQAPFEISLRDPEGIRESPGVQSRLTAAALEETLDGIAGALSRRGVRAVGILVTDLRDQLFLAREIRRRMPGVTLFTHQSNALFLWPDFADAMGGMIVVTSYPLIPGAERWLGSRGRRSEVLVFANEASEGVFNATLIQLGEDSLVEGYVRTETDSTCQMPAIWVTAVGRDGFVPLGVTSPNPPPGPNYVRCVASTHGDSCAASGRRAAAAFATGANDSASRYRGAGEGVALGAAVLLLSITLLLVCLPIRDPRRGRLAALSPVDRASRVLRSSLLAHWHLYAGLRALALIGIAETLELLAWTQNPSANLFLLFAIVAAAPLAVVAWNAGNILRLVGAEGRNTLSFTRKGASHRFVWIGEMVLRMLVVLGGIAFGVVLLVLLASLSGVTGAERDLLAYRVAHVRSALSPLVPVGLGSLALLFWCSWHLVRVTRLMEATPVEAWGLDAYAYNVMALPPEVAVGAASNLALRRALVALRVRLFLLAQRGWSILLMLPLLLCAVWLANEISPVVERYAFRGYPVLAWSLVLLYRGLAAAALVCVVWGAYRLLSVWSALREFLGRACASPLLSAFERLPGRLTSMVHVTLLGIGSPASIADLARTEWDHLRQLYRASSAPIQQQLGDEDDTRLSSRIAAMHEADTAVAMPVLPATVLTATYARADFDALLTALERMWANEPSAAEAEIVRKEVEQGTPGAAQVATGDYIRRTTGSGERLWQRALEEYVALHFVQYLQWVIGLMQRLSAFLVLTLVVSILLVGSHPAFGASLVQLVFFIALVGSITAMVYVLAQMNRDQVLSRINGTDPGRLTWNKGFILNVVTLGAVPTMAILTTAFPSLRGILSAWVQPLLRALAGN